MPSSSDSSLSSLQEFLDCSPTAWHAVDNLATYLKQKGFESLEEKDRWKIEPGKKYFVTRNGSALCAFITPYDFPQKARILASHTDSPGFKIKPQADIQKNESHLLGVEVYGSPLISSWFNRDLGIAGRIFYQDNSGTIQQALVQLDDYPVTIPQLAIHLDREVNEKGLQINKQEHLHALFAINSTHFTDKSLLEILVAEKIEIKKLISHDLFLYPLEKARFIGYKKELLASYRIDSLVSVYAAYQALQAVAQPLQNDIQMIVFWDNEEIGSHTKNGAESSFLSQILERIVLHLGGEKEDYFCLLHSSYCLSIDLAHAQHPNYSEKHDSTHAPLLGKGVVVKTNAQQRYATDAYSHFLLQQIASAEKLPLQHFVSRNDQPCGSTIGPLVSCQTGIPTIDIGCAQLSMHSCRELIACQDYLDLCQLLFATLQFKNWPLVSVK